MMIFVNEFYKYETKPKDAMKKFVLCLAPFAPHISEELWQRLGETESVVFAGWPEFDEAKTVRQTIEFVVQVCSKIRARLQIKLDATEEEVKQIALANEQVQKYVDGKPIRKVIFVPNKLINIIV